MTNFRSKYNAYVPNKTDIIETSNIVWIVTCMVVYRRVRCAKVENVHSQKKKVENVRSNTRRDRSLPPL